MATHIFSLDGVNGSNENDVLAELAKVPGCVVKAVRTAMGQFIIYVETELSEDDAFNAISAALAHLGVTVHRTIQPKPPKIKV